MNQSSNCFQQYDQSQSIAKSLTAALEPLVKLEQAKNGWIITIRAKGVFVAETLENATDVIKHHVGEP